MTATGEVQYIPSSTLVSSTFTGFAAAKGIDGDLDTYWAAAAQTAEYFGLDLGAAAAPTAYRFTPRDDGGLLANGNGLADFTQRQIGVVFQSSAASNFSSPTTYDTIPVWPPAYGARRLNERPLTTAAARYWRMYRGNAFYDLAELRILGPAAVGVLDRPIAPTMSPWGGRYPTGKCTVTIASRTTSALIYYTTDGTTPTTSSTLYSGAFQLAIGGSGTTLKAIAYDTACSTPTCETVTTAYFKPWAYKPAEDWYDDHGVLIEAHDGDITYHDGRFYWFGVSANKDQAEGGLYANQDTVNNDGVWLYSSADMLNWRLESHILNTTAQAWRYIIRPHVRWNASTSKWVLWSRSFTGANPPPAWSLSCVATASSITGPWTWQADSLDPDGLGMGDNNLFQEGAGAYAVYTDGTNSSTYVSPLASNYLTTTASPVVMNPVGTTAREGNVLFKRDSTYFWLSSRLNYYNEDLTFDLKFATRSTDLSGRFSELSDLFASNPLGTIYNNQPTAVITIPGRQGYLYMSDRWSRAWLYNSRYVWLPMSFPTATSARVDTPASWSLKTFPLTSAPVLSGGAADGTIGITTSAFTYTLQGGAFFAGDETVALTASSGVITATAPTDSLITGNGSYAVTVQPTAGSTSFSFTFTPSAGGINTIALSNGQAWTNPSTILVTVPFPVVTPPVPAGVGNPSYTELSTITLVQRPLKGLWLSK